MPLTRIIADSILVSFAGGVLSLDRTAAFQTMISRPIVTAPVIGCLLGNVEAALVVGIALELIFIGDLPVGSYIPVHETAVAVIATAFTITALGGMASQLRPGPAGAMAVFPAALLVAIPLNRLYQKADALTRIFNARFFESALRSLEMERGVMRENLKGLMVFFVTTFLALLVTALPLMLLAGLVSPKITLQASMYPAFAGCMLVGIAGALNTVDAGRGFLIFCSSGAALALFWMVWR